MGRGILPLGICLVTAIWVTWWIFCIGYFSLSDSTEVTVKFAPEHNSEAVLQESGLLHTNPSQKASPKITIIAVWATRGQANPPYVDLFFQSVEVNPLVDLLFVNVDLEGNGCTTHTSIPNIKLLCLNQREYYQLHAEFLCRHWQCTKADRGVLLSYLMKNAPNDPNYSHFRLLRNGIFERWIDPATTIWGWGDVDTFWGNFEHLFPWDVAHDFDIIAITTQPDLMTQRLLYTRGHMAFFRHSSAMLGKLLSYPSLSSLASFFTTPPIRYDAEESQFSFFYFFQDDSFTFLSIEGMVDNYDSTFVSDRGTFYSNLHKSEANLDMRKSVLSVVRSLDRPVVQSTFSNDGVEKEAVVRTEGYKGHIWFPKEFVSFIETGWNASELMQKTHFMRRVPGGPVLQRLEPRDRYLRFVEGIAIDEGLYRHFQHEKREAWFNKLLTRGLDSGETYVQWGHGEGDVWDENGDLLFEAGVDD